MLQSKKRSRSKNYNQNGTNLKCDMFQYAFVISEVCRFLNNNDRKHFLLCTKGLSTHMLKQLRYVFADFLLDSLPPRNYEHLKFIHCVPSFCCSHSVKSLEYTHPPRNFQDLKPLHLPSTLLNLTITTRSRDGFLLDNITLPSALRQFSYTNRGSLGEVLLSTTFLPKTFFPSTLQHLTLENVQFHNQIEEVFPISLQSLSVSCPLPFSYVCNSLVNLQVLRLRFKSIWDQTSRWTLPNSLTKLVLMQGNQTYKVGADHQNDYQFPTSLLYLDCNIIATVCLFPSCLQTLTCADYQSHDPLPTSLIKLRLTTGNSLAPRDFCSHLMRLRSLECYPTLLFDRMLLPNQTETLFTAARSLGIFSLYHIQSIVLVDPKFSTCDNLFPLCAQAPNLRSFQCLFGVLWNDLCCWMNINRQQLKDEKLHFPRISHINTTPRISFLCGSCRQRTKPHLLCSTPRNVCVTCRKAMCNHCAKALHRLCRVCRRIQLREQRKTQRRGSQRT